MLKCIIINTIHGEQNGISIDDKNAADFDWDMNADPIFTLAKINVVCAL